MKVKSLLTCIMVSSVLLSYAQDSDMYIKKDFLIILSTRNYKAALEVVKKAADSMHIKTDLRRLIENKTSGLSYTKDECKKEDLEYPAYYARGRWDDGVYLSIEYSNAYSGFSKGYYIVIAASGSKKDKEIQLAWQRIKPKFKDAYFKSSKVYMGCMH